MSPSRQRPRPGAARPRTEPTFPFTEERQRETAVVEDAEGRLWAIVKGAPERMLAGIDDVGNVAAFLVGDGARLLTGNVEYIDGGYHIMG